MKPYVSDADLSLYIGAAAEVLRGLPEASVHAALTSPPFFALRDYHEEGQIGLEDTPEAWAERLVEVFREVRRVLRDDGTLWIECGDGYGRGRSGRADNGVTAEGRMAGWTPYHADMASSERRTEGVKDKDMIGAPFLLAFALRADGWYWRGTYIWEKPDAMPESATDRCTTSHSYVFQFSKRARYFFDQDAIREPFSENTHSAGRNSTPLSDDPSKAIRARNNRDFQASVPKRHVDLPDPAQLNLGGHGDAQPEQHRDGERWPSPQGRNARSVWRIATEATSFGLCPVCRTYWDERAPAKHCGVDVVAHFATWPHALAGKIIACATSEAGCCGECGAPRVRVTERETMLIRRSERQHDLGRTRSSGTVVRPASSTTVGWEPSCDCDAETTPCTVLDPFAGSATTGRQARALGRRSVLIELSADYAEIAKHRLQQLSLLHA